MDREFTFELKAEHAAVLAKSKFRRAAFEAILHDSLQPMFSKKDAELQPLFEDIAQHTLHSSEKDLREYIEEMGNKLNVAFEVYINQRLKTF